MTLEIAIVLAVVVIIYEIERAITQITATIGAFHEKMAHLSSTNRAVIEIKADEITSAISRLQDAVEASARNK